MINIIIQEIATEITLIVGSASGPSGPVSWNDVSEKPTEFNPTAHGHAWNEITEKPTEFTPSAHGHTWNEITEKPTEFPSEYKAAVNRDNNLVIFDQDYVIGTPTAPRTGNITFDLTNAKIGAVTKMLHQDPNAFTFGDNVKRVETFDVTDISATDINMFMFEYGLDGASPYVTVYLLPVIQIVAAV